MTTRGSIFICRYGVSFHPPLTAVASAATTTMTESSSRGTMLGRATIRIRGEV
jgi:hypothetical protein